MWDLFVAIGTHWQLTNSPEPYRLQIHSFMENRVALNPIYKSFYEAAAGQIDALTASVGSDAAYGVIFGLARDGVEHIGPTMLQLIQQYVFGEPIALRLALGSFLEFRATKPTIADTSAVQTSTASRFPIERHENPHEHQDRDRLVRSRCDCYIPLYPKEFCRKIRRPLSRFWRPAAVCARWTSGYGRTTSSPTAVLAV